MSCYLTIGRGILVRPNFRVNFMLAASFAQLLFRPLPDLGYSAGAGSAASSVSVAATLNGVHARDNLLHHATSLLYFTVC